MAKELVQVFISDRVSSVITDVQQVVGLERVFLGAYCIIQDLWSPAPDTVPHLGY